MSDYLSITTIPSHTTARAADVNSRFQQVESAFDMLPAPDVLELAVKPTVLAGGTLNALTVTNAQPVGAYALGQEINFKAAFTNGAAATVNVDGLGNKEIRRSDGTALLAGDIVAGRIYELKYDGSFFQMMRVTAVETLSYQIAAAASAAAAFISAGDAADEATAAAASAAAAAASAASIDVSNIVHRSGAESIAGTKTFSSAIVASAGVTINGQTLSGLTAAGKAMVEAADLTAQKTLLGLGSLALLSSINGGNWSGTDLAVIDGGTGASTAAAARTNLGLVIGTDVQAQNANLAAEAGLTGAADRLPYYTGVAAKSLATFTAAGRALVDDADAAAQLTTLGFSAFGKTIIDDADASTVLSTLGVSTFIKTLLDDPDAATARATLGTNNATVVTNQGNTTNATTTPASINGNFATGTMVTGGVYRVTVRCSYSVASTSTGLGLALVGTGTCTPIGYWRAWISATTYSEGPITTSADTKAFTNATVTTPLSFEVQFLVSGITTATLEIKFNTTNVAGNAVITGATTSFVVERLL